MAPKGTPSKGNIRHTLERLAFPGCRSVDVGANEGEITRILAACGPVTAIEPDPRCLPKLTDAASKVIQAAVSDYTGDGVLYRSQTSPQNSLYEAAVLDKRTDTMPVPVRRLDDVVERADLVKIDAQGAECAILRGAPRLLATCDRWVVECWPDGLTAAGDSVLHLYDLLIGAGLTVETMEGAPVPRAVFEGPWQFGQFVNLVGRRYGS